MLRLYNTMSRSVEVFTPHSGSISELSTSGKRAIVKIFTCGPSIYRRPHIGNYRTFVFEDILVRYLEYLGYSVKRIINFTDVEDKTIREACRQQVDPAELTDGVARCFFREAQLLRLKLPPQIPRSSTTIAEAVRLIQILLDKGAAYRHRGDIFFDPMKFKGFGKLFRLDMRRWPQKKRRFHLDTYPGKRWNLGDFILWHGARDSDTSAVWDTPIGKGRPSWNIQDPAIISQHLGPSIDIHCGGIDNLYRHHDYNIAVMESVYGIKLARYWLHGEHLIVQGKPMAKSRRNILYPDNILDQGYRPEHLRFFLMHRHYQEKLNYTPEHFRQTAQKLDDVQQLLQRLLPAADLDVSSGASRKRHSLPSASSSRSQRWARQPNNSFMEVIEQIEPAFRDCLDDNLNAGAAFDRVHLLLQELDDLSRSKPPPREQVKALRSSLRRIDAVLQVLGLGYP